MTVATLLAGIGESHFGQVFHICRYSIVPIRNAAECITTLRQVAFDLVADEVEEGFLADIGGFQAFVRALEFLINKRLVESDGNDVREAMDRLRFVLCKFTIGTIETDNEHAGNAPFDDESGETTVVWMCPPAIIPANTSGFHQRIPKYRSSAQSFCSPWVFENTLEELCLRDFGDNDSRNSAAKARFGGVRRWR